MCLHSLTRRVIVPSGLAARAGPRSACGAGATALAAVTGGMAPLAPWDAEASGTVVTDRGEVRWRMLASTTTGGITGVQTFRNGGAHAESIRRGTTPFGSAAPTRGPRS